MANNVQKTPFVESLNTFAKAKAKDAVQLTGRNLPCSVTAVVGAIVTVSFQVNGPFTLPPVKMPVFGPRYLRYPIQVGDKGYAVSADAYLGGMSGLGGGVAGLTQQANLSALVFFPIGHSGWPSVDGNAVVITAPNGVTLQDDTSAATIVLHPTAITLTCGGHSISIGASGVLMDGSPYLAHRHSGVQTGGADTGGVV